MSSGVAFIMLVMPAHSPNILKVIKTGEIKKAVKLNGIGATAAAKVAIEAAGGSVN